MVPFNLSVHGLRQTVAVLAAAALLVGCETAPKVPLDQLPYTGNTQLRTQKTASVQLKTGLATGEATPVTVPVSVPSGTVYLRMPGTVHQALTFHADDQLAAVTSLRQALVQRGLVKAAGTVPAAAGDLSVQISFDKTSHSDDHTYVLNVTMTLTMGKARPFGQSYRIVSSANDSSWEKMNTNAWEGKTKAVNAFMARLIPDIEAYLAANP